MGVPVIATNWSGTTAFLDDEVGYPLPYTLQPAPHAAGQMWADPNVSALRELMRRVVDDPETLKALESPVLGIFAKNDGWITPAVVGKFEKGLKTAGVKAEIKIYDADHAFANPSGKRFHRPSARDAWKRTLAFFETHLGS